MREKVCQLCCDMACRSAALSNNVLSLSLAILCSSAQCSNHAAVFRAATMQQYPCTDHAVLLPSTVLSTGICMVLSELAGLDQVKHQVARNGK